MSYTSTGKTQLVSWLEFTVLFSTNMAMAQNSKASMVAKW